MKKIILILFLAYCSLLAWIPEGFALSNTGKIPVLAFHSWDPKSRQALYNGLRTINSVDFKIIPLIWVAEWAIGIRDGSTLPERSVAITGDDGAITDWVDCDSGEESVSSFRRILLDFQVAYGKTQPYIHATSFVIASPKARKIIEYSLLDDAWWADANASGVIEVQNHSLDHDHDSIQLRPGREAWDPAVNTYISAGAGPCGGPGIGNFLRINSYNKANREIVSSAMYIYSKTKTWPDLFAYPYGQAPEYLWKTYFPRYQSQHKTIAAFIGNNNSYVQRSSNRWLLPRFTYGYNWLDSKGLITILNGAIN